MSADAKAWPSGDGWVWQGITDACDHRHEAVGLVDLLRELEACENHGHPMRWILVAYSNGTQGLKGYIS